MIKQVLHQVSWGERRGGGAGERANAACHQWRVRSLGVWLRLCKSVSPRSSTGSIVILDGALLSSKGVVHKVFVQRPFMSSPKSSLHHAGLSPEDFNSSAALRDFFEVLSLGSDRRGRQFVSTMQAHRYPVTASQWHPEKNAFEWPRALHIPHSEQAVELMHAVARFFVSEARRSSHKPVRVRVGAEASCVWLVRVHCMSNLVKRDGAAVLRVGQRRNRRVWMPVVADWANNYASQLQGTRVTVDIATLQVLQGSVKLVVSYHKHSVGRVV